MNVTLKLARIGFIACFIASAIIGYFSVFHHDTLPGCSHGGSCHDVLSSSWAWMGPVPVAWAGALGYLLAILAIGNLARRATAAMSALVTGFMASLLAASGFFISLQAWVIGHWCPWCCTVHALSITACALTLVALRTSKAVCSLQHVVPYLRHPFCCGVLATASALTLGYALPSSAEPPPKAHISDTPAHLVPVPTSTPNGEAHEISLLGGKVHIDPYLLPILGSPAAKNMVIAIADPTCPHCRFQSKLLREIAASYDKEEVAIVFLPGTRDPDSGPRMQQLLLTLWREKPEAWHDLQKKWESASKEEPLGISYDELSELAAKALGSREALSAALSKYQKWANDQITATEKLILANAKAQQAAPLLPQLMIGKKTILGAMSGASELQSLLASEFSMPMIASAESSDGCEAKLDAATLVAPSDNDPCSRKREFCGRIVLVYNGAGEDSGIQRPEAAEDANAAVKAFIGDSPVLVPSVLFSSDPLVKGGLNLAGDRDVKRLAKSGALKLFPSSRESFDKFMAQDGHLAALKEKMANSAPCKLLMKTGEDASKYIKFEVIIASHSTRELGEGGKFRGLPIWDMDTETGTLDDYTRGKRTFVSKPDFQALYRHFPHSVFQVLICSCDSANVGEMMAPVPTESPDAIGACYCFAGLVGRDVKAPSQSIAEKWRPEDADKGTLASHYNNHAGNGKWSGADSLYEMSLSIFDNFRFEIASQGPLEYADSMFAMNDQEKNPLSAFSINSLDLLAAAAFNAGGTTTLARSKLDGSIGNFAAMLAQLETALAKEKPTGSLPVTSNKFVNEQLRKQQRFFAIRIRLKDYLINCLWEHKVPGCNNMSALISRSDTAGKKEIGNALDTFVETLSGFSNESEYFIAKPGIYSPLKADERKRFEHALSKVRNFREEYLKFQKALHDEAEAEGRAGNIRPELETLSAYVAQFEQSFVDAYFPDFVKDCLDQRQQNVLDYVRNIAAKTNLDNTSVDDFKKVKAVRDQVNCLTNFPVGPAFDKKYLLPKLPRNQPAVPGTSDGKGKGSTGKAQVYLLPP